MGRRQQRLRRRIDAPAMLAAARMLPRPEPLLPCRHAHAVLVDGPCAEARCPGQVRSCTKARSQGVSPGGAATDTGCPRPWPSPTPPPAAAVSRSRGRSTAWAPCPPMDSCRTCTGRWCRRRGGSRRTWRRAASRTRSTGGQPSACMQKQVCRRAPPRATATRLGAPRPCLRSPLLAPPPPLAASPHHPQLHVAEELAPQAAGGHTLHFPRPRADLCR